MNWDWVASLDQLWRSPSFPMWMTIAAAGFFALFVLIALMRAEKSVANGALSVITLLAVGIAVAATLRGNAPEVRSAAAESRASTTRAAVPLAALACIEDIAGDVVEQACEKVLFGSAESTAAAVSQMASMITRLVALGDAATVQRTITPEIQGLRRAIERDRYGLVAQVLAARERCTPMACPMYRSLTDNHQIITNMDEHVYDALVARYAPAWNAPPPVATASTTNGALGMMQPSMPTGRPTNAEFPSSANTPAVSIMSPEPGTGTKPPGAAAAARSAPVAPPAQAATAPTSLAPSPPPAAAKKQSAAKQRPSAGPVPAPISPTPSEPAAADD